VILITAGRQINTLTQSWCTPQKYANAINKFFNNNIDLDPCSNKDSIIEAKVKYILPIDGLNSDWNYNNIFVNPPYGRDAERKTTIKDWLKKIYDTYKEYNSEILALIPVATNTSHWKKYVFGKATGICFLSDTRLKFRINGNEDNKGSPMAYCMVYWGEDWERFRGVFDEFGYVVRV